MLVWAGTRWALDTDCTDDMEWAPFKSSAVLQHLETNRES